MFEDTFMPEKSGKKNWNLKETSRKMFEHILEKNKDVAELFKKYGLGDPSDEDNTDVGFIKEMIYVDKYDEKGKPIYRGRGADKAFLYEIIANERTGIAVHTFDFLARDCHHLGFRNVFDHFRYMKFARVIPVDGVGQLCVRDKEITNLYNLYFTKYTLTKYAYRHKVNIAVQLMLAEIMQKANKHLLFPKSVTTGKRCTIEECVDNMEAFTELDDNILHLILHYKIPENTDNEEKRRDMNEAKMLVRKILSRNLYYCVCESQPLDKEKLESVEEITDKIQSLGKDFTSSDIIVKKISFDVGNYKNDPLKSIYVYKKQKPDKPRLLKQQETSRILTLVECSEEFVRIYIRERNKDLEKNIYDAFIKWKLYMKEKDQPSSPDICTNPTTGKYTTQILLL
ncbi:deoxynucleoside triphosphate triphosphohydrolase SAMHD1-like [Physella acuta]|uniref:deoxynucleoside triphosphate triphosphohydrolase SAMHD1-like n=1 Tax=Physella acuta TaxID=109671 RepID=UPI0027DD80DA|nr:deoxynucleoside triphosphate triphosphohydrolase SAMHD1-like [Physella acuta]